jgi:hypothetical protein
MAIFVSFAVISACSKDPVTPASGPTCVAASNSIVGWWPLDRLGSGAEELVHDNHGDYIEIPLEAEGKVGGALRFDGRNDLIEVLDPGADWVYDITGDISLETWIKRHTDQPSQQVVVGKHGAYYLGCLDGHIFSEISNIAKFTGPTKVPVGEWFHVAFTYRVDTRVIAIYINGGVDSTVVSIGGYVPASSGSVYIGGLSGQQYFDGYIDEVSIYKKALSAAEIRAIYTRGSLGKCK